MQTTLHPGTIVRGRYLIEQQLGEGSGGGIYLTKDLQVKQKHFALFVLKEIITASKQERYHFTLSAVALTKLTHPSLPHIIRAFSDDKYERAYLLIEYIEGESLEKLRQTQEEKHWSLSEVVAMMEPIMDAISYLHKQEPPIIHRNIAPTNIIMSARENGPVLINPGVPEEQAVASQVGSNGLLNYEAPELYSEGASVSTDIYALGASCYTLLTGIIPADAFYRSAELENETDPLVLVDEVLPDLPPAVADVIHRAMAMNSDDRFASVEQFGRALKAAQLEQVSPAIESVSAVPVRTPVAAAKSMLPVRAEIVRVNSSEQSSRRRLARFAILLVLLLIVIGGSASAYVLSQRAAKPVSATSAPLVTATMQQATKMATDTGAAPSSTPPATSIRPTATSIPTAPMPSPTITSATYPRITGSYGGTIVDQDGKTKTNLLLTHVQQNQGNLQGGFSGLQLQGSFHGTVDSQGNLQLTVTNSAGDAVLFLEGAMQSSDSLSGDYYPCNSAQGSQCKRMAGGGVWNVIHA